jgi:pimeloyl-ACP methyl ester carboxylesterase
MFTDVVGYTAMMGRDEKLALASVEQSRALIRARVEAHAGRFLDYEGDGTLSTFASAVEAVAAATEIRDAAGDLNLRIGVHVGDVIENGDQIMGDGVNVAARICALADSGQVYVSDTVYDQVRNQSGMQARCVGTPSMKNVHREIVVGSIGESDERSGIGSGTVAPASSALRPLRRAALVAAGLVAVLALVLTVNVDLRYSIGAKLALAIPGAAALDLEREISFAESADGTRIAWATVGQGMPVVQVQVWSTHVEYGPLGPRDALPDFLEGHQVVYYDGRGFGLSERGVEHSFDKRLQDLEAVVEASGLDQFAMWGFSGGTPTAIAYAAKHPERVTRLVLYGTVLRQPLDDETLAASLTLIRKHWGSNEPVFRDYFRGLMVPDATEFEMHVFEEFFAKSGSGEDAYAYMAEAFKMDVSDLARQVRVPTLVLHRRDDVLVPFELGVETASLIPGAKFEAFTGKNHVFLPSDAEGARAMNVIADFIDDSAD